MILVYGTLDDTPICRLVEALQAAGAAYLLLEQSALEYEHIRIDVGRHGVDGTLVVAGQNVPLGSVRSIYARPLGLPSRSSVRVQQLHDLFVAWLDVSSAVVVSRPRAMQTNGSKPLQAQLIGEAGFRVPETLVTSDPADARAFWRAHGRVIFKSVSGVRSIVQELDEVTARRLDRVATLATQFQAYVPGIDVRVHVVGRETFATEITSTVVDYRYAARAGAEATLRATDLPCEIAARCVALAHRMELPLAGIDLRRRPDGEYVCLEVNPMPAYTYFEDNTGAPISGALAALLIDGDQQALECFDGAGSRESHAPER